MEINRPGTAWTNKLVLASARDGNIRLVEVESARQVASRDQDLGSARYLRRAHQQVEIVELARGNIAPGLQRQHRSLEGKRGYPLRAEQARHPREFTRAVQVVELLAIEF